MKNKLLLILTAIMLCGKLFSLNQNSIDSLKLILSKTSADTNRIKIWIQIASEYRRENYTLCSLYCDSIEKLSEKRHYTNGLGFANYYRGLSAFFAENKSGAIFFYKKAIPYFKAAGNKFKEADSYLKVGSVNLFLSNYAEATEYLIESSKLFELIKDTANLVKSFNNVSIAYANSGNNDLAEKYLLKALEVYLRMGDREAAFGTYTNLGNLMDMNHNYNKAMAYLEKSLVIANDMNDDEMKATAYTGLCLIQASLNEYQKSIQYANMAIALSEKMKVADKLITIYNVLFTDYLRLNNTEKAMEALNKAYSYVSEETYLNDVRSIYENYSVIYEKKGDYKNALKFHKLYTDIKDSVYNIENAEKIASLNVKYETEVKQQQLKLQETEIDKQSKLNEQRNIQLFIVLILLTLTLILTVFVYRNYSLAKKQKTIIEKKNTENELLLGEIHHRVKNNLQVISSLLSLQERDVTDEGVKSAILEGKERVKSMELVHKMLYRENKFSGIEMRDYVNNLSLGLLESFGLTKNDVVLNTNFKAITLDVDTAVPLGLILNELIVNSLKHAKTATEKLNLKIEIAQNNKQELSVTLSDNGTGKVSDIETSDSFGLKIVRALIRQLKGAMEIREENGLHYSIEIKNYKLIT